MIPESEVKAMLGRANAATPGPWRAGSPHIHCTLSHHPHGEGNCKYEQIGWQEYYSAIHQDRPYTYGQKPDDNGDVEAGLIAGMWDYEEGGVRKQEDAEFMAHARTDLPRLADAYLELSKKYDDLSQAVANDAVLKYRSGK